jgi:holliday junction DNA helicase RuvA
MIGLLKGKLEFCNKNPIVVLVGGVGYEVNVTGKSLSIMKSGNEIIIHTYTHVRDDALELYGFLNREDLEIFRMLITVSGIGPKTALLVSDRGALAIKEAIIKSDTDFFTTIPRLGKKNAQKIIIELKNKLGSMIDLDLTENSTGETGELIEALTQMGFSRIEIINAIKKSAFVNEKFEERIRKILKMLGKK